MRIQDTIPRQFLELVGDRSKWTDEQWAENDAKVREQIEAESAAIPTPDARDVRRDMQSRGFSTRSLREAGEANVDHEAVRRVMAWRWDAKCVLVLSGSQGCGKTVAATRWAMDKMPCATFLRATTFASSSRYNHEQRAEWLDARALILDDLGTEYADAKGSFQVDLDELIDTFYGDEKPLIITTNCTAPDFKTRYGARVSDRLRECGDWISISAKSLRAP